MISEGIFIALIGYAGTLTLILGGVIRWIVIKQWKLHSEKMPEIEDRISALEQTLLGNPEDPEDYGHKGEAVTEFEKIHQKLGSIEKSIDTFSEFQNKQNRRHKQYIKAIEKIADALNKAGIDHDLKGEMLDSTYSSLSGSESDD